MFHPGGVHGARHIAQSLHHVKNAIRGTCSSKLLMQQKAAVAVAVESKKGTVTPPPTGPAPTAPAAPSNVEVYIDDKMVMVEPGTTVLQAAALAGVRFPVLLP